LRGLETVTSVGPISLLSDVYARCEAMLLQGQVQFVLAHAWAQAESELTTQGCAHVDIGLDQLVAVSAPAPQGGPLHPLQTVDGVHAQILTYSPESGMGRILREVHGRALDRMAWQSPFQAHLASVLRTMALDGRGLAWLPKTLIADDGSLDDTAEVLHRHFGLSQPPLGQTSRTWLQGAELIWLRLPHGGKARALNAALARLDSDIVVTVDADTLLAPDALRAMADAFEAQPRLVAATGVLQPVCAPTLAGRWLQACQQLEYVRNFLTRHAWMRLDGLLLISGAFAGFRRQALVDVGGFDPLSMVEDYEVLHRLRRFGALHHRGWTTAVVGAAQAITDAPATPAAFLRQRRRWFGGFLQTQWWYRDMVGDPAFGAVGTRMLPSKAMDTLQPLFAWFSLAVVLIDLARGTASWMPTVLTLVGLKSLVDLLALLWLTRIYGQWQGVRQPVWRVVLLTLIDPYTFQPLRQLGALLGWWQVCQARQTWGASSRGGLVGAPASATQLRS